jgi:hypothetical protein
MPMPLGVELALTDAHNHAAGRLVLGRIGEQDAAGGLLFALFAFDDDAITEGDEARLLLGGLGGCG